MKLLKVLFFINFFRTLNEQLPCLAEKFWAWISNLKIVFYVFRVSCCGYKDFFESFVSFPFIRTWNKFFLDLWQQSFLPGCQNCTLRVYLNPFEMLAWDVKQYKQKLFLKFGGKYSTCLFKLQSTCPKEHFE